MATKTIHRTKDDQGRQLMDYYLGGYYVTTYAENDYDPIDFSMTARTNSSRQFCGDVKAYTDPQHPRYSYKFSDYQIDYEKLRQIKKNALNTNRTPILISIFSDSLYVWDLDKSKWETTATWKLVNKDGCSYGEKEWELQAFLKFEDAIYTRKRDDNDIDILQK